MLDPSGDLDGRCGVDGKGVRRSPLGFVEAQGISSNLRSPSGPCIPSQHSEKARPCIPCILLVTVDRNRLRGDAEWETCALATDGSWKLEADRGTCDENLYGDDRRVNDRGQGDGHRLVLRGR